MIGMRAATVSVRTLWAALFALLLAVRLLSPAGFMPAFEQGSVSIVACPDADFGAAAAPSMHHQHNKAKHQQPCPYASATSLGALGDDFSVLVGILTLAIALLLGRTLLFVDRQSAHLRPPLRGPPLPA